MKPSARIPTINELYAKSVQRSAMQWRQDDDADVLPESDATTVDASQSTRTDSASLPTVAELYERSVRASANAWRQSRGDAPPVRR